MDRDGTLKSKPRQTNRAAYAFEYVTETRPFLSLLDIVFRLPDTSSSINGNRSPSSLVLILSGNPVHKYFPKTVLEAETSLGNESPR